MGIICVADDILVYGTGGSQKEAITDHDEKLEQLLERCADMNIKLNKAKSVFRVYEILFLGHIVSSKGLKANPQKISAVTSMPAPTNVKEVQRLVGFVNYLGKFLPGLSETLEPIRQLTKTDIAWEWSDAQENAFIKVKKMVCHAPYYNSTTRMN